MTPGRSLRCRSWWARRPRGAGMRSVISSAVTVTRSSGSTPAAPRRRRRGAELLLARPLAGVCADGTGCIAELSGGTVIRGRAVLLGSGVEWRRLDVPGVDDLLGAGVHYGAGPSEALACTGSRVVVV